MQKTLIILTVAAVCLSGCKKSATPSGSTAKSGDAVQQKLQELAGSGATDCGRLQSQAQEHMKPASDCAMQAAQSKHPFYVAYDMPGLTTGVSGDAAGKLYFVQAEQPQDAQPGVRAAIQSSPCPSELRVALSGRVTCFAAGTMGPGAHGGMPMPPSGAENPHGGMGLPPSGTPNPHAGKTAAPPPKKN
ncbi:MAG: hypothetical protein ACHP78_09025 [Terriglobales bacterium]